MVECKNEKSSIVLIDLNHLLRTMLEKKINTGVFISIMDFAGPDDSRTAKRALNSAFHRLGDIVLRIILEEIKRLETGEDLLKLLIRKYEEIRFSCKWK